MRKMGTKMVKLVRARENNIAYTHYSKTTVQSFFFFAKSSHLITSVKLSMNFN